MHRNVFALILIICPGIFAFESPASILDLLSWDFENRSEAEKRDESSYNVAERSCACDGPSCKCCVDFNITYVDLGGPGCVHMKYISQEEGIAVNVSYGESLLHSEKVKGPNPEPTCMSLLADLAQVCARFSNLYPVEEGLKGCLQLEPKLLGQLQTQFDIGCFTIGPDGMKLDSTSNSTLTPLIPESSETKNATQTEPEELNEEELIAAVNETAEQGLVFFGNWLGLFGKPDVNATNSDAGSETNSATESSTVVPAETSRKARILSTTQNQI